MAADADVSSVHAGADECELALVVLDVMSTWRFPQGRPLAEATLRAAPVIARLAARCRAAGVPVIYANDHEGRWRSDWRQTMADVMAAGGRGARIATLLAPERDDYFVLKPHQSAFFGTPLQMLLQHLGTAHLLIAGASTDQCVLATAMAARMHGLRVSVPRDAVAAPSAARQQAALRHLRQALKIATPAAVRLRLD